MYIYLRLKCIFPVTEELNKTEFKDGADVYSETGVSEESVNVLDSAKLTDSDCMPISHKCFVEKAGRERKRIRKVSKQAQSMISSAKEKCLNAENIVDTSSKNTVGNILHSLVTPSGVVHDTKNAEAFDMEVVENLRSLKDSKTTEQKMDAKMEHKGGDMESSHINNQQKCYDSLCMEHKDAHNVASDSYGTSGCKRNLGDILQQDCSKQNVGQVPKVRSSMETIKCKTPKESMDITVCTGTADYTSKASNNQSQKGVPLSSNSVKCTASSREKNYCDKEMSASVIMHKPEQKLEDFKLINSKYEPEPAYTYSSMVSCIKEEKEKLCVENSCMHAKPVRTSAVVNLTTPNIIKKLESTNMDKG
jgi:hypothetical protein